MDPPQAKRLAIHSTTAKPDEHRTRLEAPSDEQLRAIIFEALPSDLGLTPLKGFKMGASAHRGFRKVFFSARCDCGTAALLSVEVAQEKGIDEISQALPVLMSKLEGQANLFYSMSCDVHKKLRLGPAAG